MSGGGGWELEHVMWMVLNIIRGCAMYLVLTCHIYPVLAWLIVSKRVAALGSCAGPSHLCPRPESPQCIFLEQ